MNKENLDKLIKEALEIEAENARQAGALGYMARSLVAGHNTSQKNER